MGIPCVDLVLRFVDEEYWRLGYVMSTCCTPSFLEFHAGTLLTAGKALNLLRLCNPTVSLVLILYSEGGALVLSLYMFLISVVLSLIHI